ncbi:efflux RND transporter periplasmic adaptor subunit [Pseudomonas lopnurensis]|uniref:efflux RND transporter periplasmic adaptor subunit n=1 Tax=Pseudomonas lopnurensis TaxID=1477517 RepID=UPI0028A76893|nr:HlyD family efflux transporter periplasmic adaptor subunit [Pseudomonas lopnurensis]
MKKNSKGWKRGLPWGFAVLLLALLVVSFWPKPIPVETAAVDVGPLTVSVSEEGKTRVRQRYVVSPPIAGFLERIPLRAGATVIAGQTVLAVLHPEPSGFLDPRSKAQAEAALQAARGFRQQRQAELERSEVVLDLAQKQFARADALRKSGTVTEQAWDEAGSQLQVRRREASAARFALDVAGFEVEQAQAALMQAVSPASESMPLPLVAPVSGHVLNVFEENARVVAAGQPLLEVGDLQDLEAEIELLSSDAVGVAPGAEVIIEQWGGDRPLRGRVALVERGGFTKVSALGVEEQRVKVRVDFLEWPAQVLGDRYRVEARIVTWHGDQVLQVPTGALFRRGNRWMAFQDDEGTARLREVEIGRSNGIHAQVLAGLSEKDRVIVHPPDSITDGAAVEEVKTAR